MSPVIINETSDHRSRLSRSKPADVKSVCHFHLQGRCKHGRIGTGCKYSHPNLCKKIILKGEHGCSNGDKCRFTHPRPCVGSCLRKKCFLYHVTGSSRPNLPLNIGANEGTTCPGTYSFDVLTYYLNGLSKANIC